MRVLVVDDEPAVRSSLQRALVLDGHEVDVAVDGYALQRLALAAPDATIVDVLMPNLDGLEVCDGSVPREIRLPCSS